MSIFPVDWRIRLYFLRHRRCHVKLPDGWFGRPYDSYYSLVKVEIDDDTLTIELTFSLRLIFRGIPELESKADGLHLTDFDTFIFEGGKDGVHNDKYTSGEVHLVTMTQWSS